MEAALVLLGALLASACAVSAHAAEAASKPHETPPAAPEILVVGRAGPVRPITAAQRDALSSVASPEKVAGSASIAASSGPFGWHERTAALVRAAPAPDTPFASGDLVAARGRRDGAVWLDRVLCRSGRSFAACAEKYQAGLFDGDSGREIDRDGRRKPDGEWIDVTSYVRLSKDPEPHKASELDPRAINKCDDCKGSIPGSVQATVPPPQLDNR
jgi:hypothetical protein